MKGSGILIVSACALLMAACGTAPVRQAAVAPPLPPPPPPVLVDPDSACRADLTAAHVSFQALDRYGEGKCQIANPVRITADPVPLNRPGVLGCDTARTLTRFVEDVVQPLAQKYFGQPVVRIDHLGTYDCRTRRTETASKDMGGSKAGRLSEHAMGRAIDFSGVELADGRSISVKDNWRSAGAPGTFLHQLARDACRSFNVVLTPNHDKLHWDHIHMDTGPYTLCGY